MNAQASRLTDGFGRRHDYLRISVTDRCNLRCQYCMPEEGIVLKKRDELLTYEEIHRLASIFVGMGVEKIRITGGEPLVRPGLEKLVAKLAGIEGLKKLALTTNGVFLAGRAESLRAAGIQFINISLDTLNPERFSQITLRQDFARVMDGIEAALAAGFSPLKLNVVVMKGLNDLEVLDFVNFVKDRGINVRFIEYMPFKNNKWDPSALVAWTEVKELIEKEYVLEPLAAKTGDVAKDFAIAGHTGSVSFISSMTDSFCLYCRRLRLTADGALKSCLFYDAEINLKEKLRLSSSDMEIEEMIIYALAKKPESHPPVEELASMSNRAMVDIGG
jgi:GTP 3',8-cyclase